MSDDIFADRCLADPQGVIKDLMAQSTRQAVEIHRLGLLTEAVLLPDEATYLLQVMSNCAVGRFDDEKLAKKLKIIENSKEKTSGRKSKKKKEPADS